MEIIESIKFQAKLVITFLIVALISIVISGVGIYKISDGNQTSKVIFWLIILACSAMSLISGIILMKLKSTVLSMDKFCEEVIKMSKEHKEGKIDVFIAEEKYEGKFKEISSNINDMVKIHIAPILEAQEVMKKIEVNDFVAEMKGKYKGEAGEFSNSVNGVIKRLLSVQDAFVKVSVGDTSRLEEFKRIGKRSENDKLMPAVAHTMEVIKNLIDETKMLSDAAVNGDLQLRGETAKFDGEYKKIIQGINDTMDAVVKPIEEALAVMQEMSGGNLTVSMNGDYKGDYGRLRDEVNSTIISFNNVLNEIETASMQVASGSRQVSDSAQTLSVGSTEQASAIEELTSSMEEISSQTMSNAENANKANQLAVTAKEGAIKGNEQMQEMLTAMEDINKSSSNIYKIIKVIDEIAFQTNILALNAAVEAARAGQHGKGFAVVAEEVRNLAARSASAAKETTDLIEGSIDKAEGGSKIAKETAEALSNIVQSVAKSAELVGEIAVASNEQAAGIEQVNQGIIQVSQVTQNNSATSEESAAASEELSGQAEMLRQMVSKFTLRKTNTSYNSLVKENYKISENVNQSKKVEVSKNKTKIILSDNEFGKY